LYNLGYLGARYQIVRKPGGLLVDYIAEDLYELSYLGISNIEEVILNKVGYSQRSFNQKPFSYREISGFLNSVLDYAENHGYPFARVRLDSIHIIDNNIYSIVTYDRGPYIVFDSVAIEGMDRLKYKFLMSHLGAYHGKAYEQKKVDQIPKKISSLDFLQLIQNPDVHFADGKATIILKVKERKVNKIDGIIGFLPNETNREKLLITGQLTLDLHNLFSSGKNLFVNWQRIEANSQLLDLQYRHPKLLRSPLDIAGGFYLLKQDTTFINRNFFINLSFIPGLRNSLGLTTDFRSSRLLSTSQYEDISQLPTISDFNLTYYGIEYEFNTFDDYIFPSRGISYKINGFIGQKKIIENSAFDEGLYAGLDLNDTQYKFESIFESYKRVWKNMIFRFNLSGGLLRGDNVFVNDLFRLGGLQSIRGFNENFFFATDYLYGNLELRMVFANNTYFMLFYDQGYISNKSVLIWEEDFPLGAGAGFSLATTAGIFNFVFALGRSNTQPFDFSFSKIHFGYVSRF
jgi:outer membrane translocation and assembly module TamA